MVVYLPRSQPCLISIFLNCQPFFPCGLVRAMSAINPTPTSRACQAGEARPAATPFRLPAAWLRKQSLQTAFPTRPLLTPLFAAPIPHRPEPLVPRRRLFLPAGCFIDSTGIGLPRQGMPAASGRAPAWGPSRPRSGNPLHHCSGPPPSFPYARSVAAASFVIFQSSIAKCFLASLRKTCRHPQAVGPAGPGIAKSKKI